MLNISPKSVSKEIDFDKFEALSQVENWESGKGLIRLILIFFILLFGLMFLPWTQNIRSDGYITTLMPDQRPQTIHSIIDGRIEAWYVREGDFVEKGDTILFISEIKDAYWDPDLLQRTQEQVNAKASAIRSYDGKVNALNNQIKVLGETSRLKLQQAENKFQQSQFKLKTDSIDLVAKRINLEIAQRQLDRIDSLYKDGLKSLTEYESRKLKWQKAQAEKISAENKVLGSRNEVINAHVELSSIEAQYQDKIAKSESDKFSALSGKYDAEATLSKLQNQYANYSVRQGLYYITAPQNGFITKAIQSGLGETVKAGEEMMSIMPSKYELAVEMYVKPLDLPLLNKEQKVRIMFDGWPAIVFSGWPNTSVGTYGGKVFAIDNFISDNGMYRVLVAPDEDEHIWPNALRVGAGTQSMILLNEVPVWYELWRQINDFPPDFYDIDKKKKEKVKAPIKLK
ncbi:MAG: HlyD family efflux transporter periplasmic adaptor subunit [Bacteroidia bacterium]|nr:HlyD family efflux transporter periplasmic adaptor subunit [Bacteroidia bacterium]